MAKKRGLSRASTLAIRLGPTSAKVKLQATPKQWRSFVKQAHGRGQSMEEYFTGVPPALSAKNPGQLAAQAKKTISSAYAPTEAELGSREGQIQALAAKRERDDAYYRDWLANNTATLSQDIKTSNQMITDKLTGADEQARAAYAQAAGAASANLQQQAPGLDFSGSNAVAQLPVQAAIANTQRTGETKRELTAAQLSSGMAAATQANALAAHAADEAHRTSETWKALSEVASDKQKVALSKAADIAKEVARLMDNERSKAMSNRDYGALLQKLDLQGQELTLKGQKQRSDARLKGQQNRESRRYHNQLNQAKTDDRLYRQSKDEADRKLKRDEFIAKYGKTPEQWRKMTDAERLVWTKKYSKSQSKGGGSKDLTPGQKLKNIQTGNQFISSINTLASTIKIAVDPKTKVVTVKNRQKLIDQGYSSEMIDVAYDIVQGKKIGSAHPLSDASRKYVKRILRGYPGTKMPSNW